MSTKDRGSFISVNISSPEDADNYVFRKKSFGRVLFHACETADRRDLAECILFGHDMELRPDQIKVNSNIG